MPAKLQMKIGSKVVAVLSNRYCFIKQYLNTNTDCNGRGQINGNKSGFELLVKGEKKAKAHDFDYDDEDVLIRHSSADSRVRYD